MSTYWDELRAAVRAVLDASATDPERIRLVAAIEAEAIRDVRVVLGGERWLPADLRQQIEFVIDRRFRLLRDSEGEPVLSAEAGMHLFENRASLLIGRLQVLFVEIRCRLIADRFGGVLDDDVGSYVARVHKVETCIAVGTHHIGHCAMCDEHEVEGGN